MYGPAPQRGPSTVFEWAISGVFITAFVGLFAAEIYHDFSPAKLSILLIVLFWIPLLALHEAGHAAVAWLLGWYVGQIVVGMEKAIGRFRVGTANIEVRLIPVEGFVRCVPTRVRLPRLESALIYFAGPGVELLLALCILFVVGSDRLLSVSQEYWLIFWQNLALAAASQAILNLIPFAVHTRDGILHSDGLGIMVSFRRPIAYYEQMIGQTYNQEQQEWEA